MAARISEIFLTKNPESAFFYKESKSNKINSGGMEGRGWGWGGGGVARLSDLFFQKNPSLKKKCFLLEGVKVREDWLV